MAGRTKKRPKGTGIAVLKGHKPVRTGRKKLVPELSQDTKVDLTDPAVVKDQVARLYGRGFERNVIAKAMAEHLCPGSIARTREQLLSQARRKLRNWERNQEFRDLVYRYAVAGLDIELPKIMGGIAKSAKKGRVDAARLALEVTGRHTREDQPPTSVTVNIANIPRPEG